jgi:hypothetical protein
MIPVRVLGIAASMMSALAVGSTSVAAMDGTSEQRMACAPDVFRLCRAEIPKVHKIIACMETKRADLSDACRVVFTPELLFSVKAQGKQSAVR